MKAYTHCLLTILFGIVLVPTLQAQTNAITYQGQLTDGGTPANGTYDFSFELFNDPSAGSSWGSVTTTAVVVSNGLCTVQLDYGPGTFDGTDLWLEIGAVINGGGSFKILSPRQPITSAPYAIYAASVDAAGVAGNITSSQIADGTITTSDMASDSITGTEITDGSIVAADLGLDIGVWSVNGSNVYRSAGKVGIGTTNPVTILHVKDSSHAEISVESTDAGGHRYTLRSARDTGDERQFSFQIVDWTGGARRMVILTNGNVGFGPSIPESALHVQDSSHAEISIESTDPGGHRYTLRSARDTGDARQFSFQIVDWTGGTRRMVILTNGNMGVGVTIPSYKLEVNGSVAGMGAYVNTSDIRYKKDVQSLTNALERVLHLRGVSFDWRRQDYPEINFDRGRQLGFIAQELEPVVPEAVSRGEDGILRIAYSEVIPVLVEAIKTQQEEIDALKRRNAANTELRRELEELRQALEQMKEGAGQ